MTQDQNPIEAPEALQAGASAPGKRPARWLGWARTVAAITLPCALAAIFIVVLLAGLGGGAHGSGPGGALLLAAAAIAFLPLALFAPIRWRSGKFWHAAGSLALAINVAVVLPVGYDLYRQVSYVPPGPKERDAMLLAVHLVGSQSELITDADGPWGIRSRLTIRVDREIPLDQYGELALRLVFPPHLYINDNSIYAAGSRLPLGGSTRNLRVSLDGVAQDVRALERLTQVAHGQSTPVGVLHAGVYEIEAERWFEPVSVVSGQTVRCIDWNPGTREKMERLHGTQFKIQFKNQVWSTLAVTLESEPVHFTYDHERWMRQLSSLNLPECSALK